MVIIRAAIPPTANATYSSPSTALLLAGGALLIRTADKGFERARGSERSAMAAAGEVDHIAVCRFDDRLGQRHRVEAKIGQRLSDALAVQLGDHHLDNLQKASSLGGSAEASVRPADSVSPP